jgi:hypothetical protein
MICNYTLEYRDFIAAQRLYRQRTVWRMMWFVFWLWFAPVIGWVSAGLCVYCLMVGRTSSETLFLWLWIWLGILNPIMRIYQLRKIWKNIPPPGMKTAPVELEWNSEKITSRLVGRSEGSFFWNSLLGYEENEQLILLFIRKKQFLFIPKRALSEAAQAEIRTLVKQGKG